MMECVALKKCVNFNALSKSINQTNSGSGGVISLKPGLQPTQV